MSFTILNRNIRPLQIAVFSLLMAFVGLALGTSLLCADTKTAPQNAGLYWTNRVEPILDKKCLKCHAGVHQQGGLDLRSLDTILRGGDSGPEIVPGKPADSRIIEYVSPPSGPHMPPDPTRRLTPVEISTIKTWVAMLPTSNSKLAGSKDNSWVAGYLTDYRRANQSHEVLPAEYAGSASAAIDWFLRTDWKKSQVVSARLCADNVFVRRAYLDITGHIPTKAEMQQFMADNHANKRKLLVDQLLGSVDYARHMRDVFDTVLMGRPTEKTARERVESGWNSYLENAFQINRPWNEMVSDILVGRPTDKNNQGSEWFLAERNNSAQAIAEAVAPVVYGVQIKCAQCHNHPLAWEIEQRHYWGLVAVFIRSSNVKTAEGLQVGESAIGGFNNFANLKKETQPALLVFLNGKSVNEHIPGPNEKSATIPLSTLCHHPKKAPVRIWRPYRRYHGAKSSPKLRPTITLCSPRAFVNRMWDCLMGLGIVSPADQIDSRHPASHPELLEWLAQDFERNGYNIKQLVRSIVLSRAYQLDSGPVPGSKLPPLPETFARGLEKPLTGEQLYQSIVIATGTPAGPGGGTDKKSAFTAAFPDIMPDTYNPTLQQALFMTNSPVLDDMLKPLPGNTASRLMAESTPDQRVKDAFLTVLGRSPDGVELRQCKLLLAAQSPEKGVKNLLWALLSGAEFKVNH